MWTTTSGTSTCGAMARCRTAALAWASGAAPPGAPARLFLKLPRSNLKPESTAWAGEKEVRMYRAFLTHQRDLPIIQCYDAIYDADLRKYHLLLDDLSDTHDQPAWHLE